MNNNFIISNTKIFIGVINKLFEINYIDEFFGLEDVKHIFLYETMEYLFKENKMKKTKNLLEHYNKIKNSNSPQDIFQFFIFYFEICNLSEEQRQKLEKFHKDDFNELFESINLDKNYVWSLIEDDKTYIINGKKNLRKIIIK